jgi:hypothetical protein
MRIARARDPEHRAPRTRRELLSHLWALPDLKDCNVFKEGPFYALRVGRVIAATHLRTIDSLTFNQWAQRARSTPRSLA